MIFSRKFSLREKVLLLILALLLLVLLYFFSVEQTVSDSRMYTKIEMSSARSEIELLETKKKLLAKMEEELAEIKKNPNAPFIPDYDNLNLTMQFLNTVLDTADDYSMSFLELSMPEEDGHIVRRPLRLSFCSSSYKTASRIITDLQNSPYSCKLGDLTISPLGGGRDAAKSIEEGSVQVELTMTFYESTRNSSASVKAR